MSDTLAFDALSPEDQRSALAARRLIQQHRVLEARGWLPDGVVVRAESLRTIVVGRDPDHFYFGGEAEPE